MRSAASLTILILLFGIAIVYAGGIRVGSASAYSNGTNILVHWVSDDETGMSGFEVARRTADGQFIVLTSPLYPCKGNGFTYEFVDNTAFRTSDSFYQYRITAVYADGRTSEPFYVSVSHNTSGVRRTWGSIKAMFR